MRKRIAIVYFSFTGKTADVVNILYKFLKEKYEPYIFPIIPERKRAYWEWLLLSFLPGSSVNINFDNLPSLEKFHHLILAFPKWTVSCPPVNSFLKYIPDMPSKQASIIVTYGGFDGKRYMEYYKQLLSRKGFIVKNELLVRRRDIGKENLIPPLISLIEKLK